MNGFRRHGDTITGRFAPAESALLVRLAGELGQLLAEPDADDPALLRLLPEAYPDDPEASAEFRHYTTESLAQRKIANGGVVASSLAAGLKGDVTLDAQAAQAWLRSLTDIRLALASRLGIETEEDEGDDPGTLGVYHWLGFLQESLLIALESGR